MGRTKIHLTAPRNWINDPNGFIIRENIICFINISHMTMSLLSHHK